jgi:hypothetical protein
MAASENLANGVAGLRHAVEAAKRHRPAGVGLESTEIGVSGSIFNQAWSLTSLNLDNTTVSDAGLAAWRD